jgi:hypothetical protein
MMTTEIFNEMAGALEKASMRLCIDDVAFIIALLLQSVSDAAPTEESRLSFVASFAKHMATLTQTRVRWLLTDEPPNHKGAVN